MFREHAGRRGQAALPAVGSASMPPMIPNARTLNAERVAIGRGASIAS
jgi:hypothetical protein